MVATVPVQLQKNSQKAFIEYYRSIQASQNSIRSEGRAKLALIDKEYQRQIDYTTDQQRAKRANRGGDPNRYQNMTVPVIMPQVEAAVTYQTSVFLTGYPIFGVVSDPEYIDAALQLESVLRNNAKRGGWSRQLMMFFRDGFKHNLSYLNVDWDTEVTYAPETNVEISTTEGVPKRIIWAGNTVERWDPYNSFIDPSVLPTQVYKDGEFAGNTKFMSRIQLKAFISRLSDAIISNITPAFESPTAAISTDSSAMNFFIPNINPDVTPDEYTNAGTNWLKWAGLSDSSNSGIQYKDGYEVTTLYCRVLPSEFKLRVPNRNTPQVYKLIIINHQWIIYSEKQTNAHGWLPVLIGQPNEDGLAYQTKSLAENGEDFQQLTTTYMNSIIASRRRAISDRALYDPSRITEASINSANPSAKIPVRPAAYGKNVGEAVYAFPYREDQEATSMRQITALLQLSNTLVGQNQTNQGQFTKGNRTLEEFDTVMQNANGRDQMSSILYEDQVFLPMKQILKLNTLQYQGGTSVFNEEQRKVINVDPVVLREAVLDFTVTDGLLPASKVMNGETFGVALQVVGSSPRISQQYNEGPMFSYLMKTQGADLSSFEKSQEQVAYEQAVGVWQQSITLMVDKDVDPKNYPPQPLPEQFGYDPAANTPQPEQQETTEPNLAQVETVAAVTG